MYGIVPNNARYGPIEGVAARVDRRLQFRRREPGEAEVQQLGVAAPGNKDVAGFDVAMEDAFTVRGVESVGDLDGNVQPFAYSQLIPTDHRVESGPLEALHDDERGAIIVAIS
jgi:hypothetical protein